MRVNRYIGLMEDLTGTPFRSGNSVTMLHNGDEIFPAMLEAIRGAESRIEFLSYIFMRGQIAEVFAEALAGRARAGVKVRLLLDALGGAGVSSRTIWQLERAGVQVAWFRPGGLGQWRKLNNRTHRKILLVDGRVGFTGGVGIADMWTGAGQDERHWRETHCRVAGPACLDLHTGFAENWREATGETLEAPRTIPPAGDIGVHTTISTAGGRPTVSELFLDAVFAAARQRLWITTAYFVPVGSIVPALIEAARRGVDVRVLTNGTFTDHRITLLAGRASYWALLESGIKIYEYQKTMLHAKVITADRSWGTVGSLNLDARSLVLNDELNVSVVNPELVSALDRRFLADLEHARHIRRAHWSGRGRLNQMLETGSNTLRRQL